MCDRLATTKEHVPAKCFFPKDGETASTGLRTNLVTVPSCDLHNSSKAKDDEYACLIVASSMDVNPVGATFSGKRIVRAVRKRPTLFGIFRNPFPVQVGGKSTMGFEVDITRFHNYFDHTLRGVFYHHFKRKFLGDLKILTPTLVDVSSPNRAELNLYLREFVSLSAGFFRHRPKYGQHQEVFYYQVFNAVDEDPTDRRIVISLVFYEGVLIQGMFISGADFAV